jgi:putative PIN family toxin of toxin-antitoxin system
MTGSTRRVIFDCNVLLQALGFPRGPAGRCVQHAFDGRVLLFLSPLIIEELRDVARRPKVAAKMRISAEGLEEFIAQLESVAVVLTAVPDRFSYERDPDDAHYINVALAASAELVVSRDRDLLDLSDPALPDSMGFRQRFPSLRILSPEDFLREVEG